MKQIRTLEQTIVPNSLMLNSANSQYLNRTFVTPTSSTIYTISTWVKRGKLGVLQDILGASTNNSLAFSSTNALVLTLGGVAAATSTSLFGDSSIWLHVVYQQNGSAQTLYANGNTVATGTTANTVFNTAVAHQLGAANTANYLDGYLSNTIFVDGQALLPTAFAKSDAAGKWMPIAYTGTYGNNGFALNFSNALSLGADSSGNGNNWTLNGGITSALNQFVDSPTQNYPILNPTFSGTSAPSIGNLTTTCSVINKWSYSTESFNSGSYYVEFKCSSVSVGGSVGVIKTNKVNNGTALSGSGTEIWTYAFDGHKWGDGAYTASYGSSWTSGDTIGIAVNSTIGTITFYKNGVSQGVAFTSLLGVEISFGLVQPGSGSSITGTFNFGATPFAYTPPIGFLPLNSINAPVQPSSLLFDYTQSQYLSRTFGAPTSQNIFTLSTWIKKCSLGVDVPIIGVSNNCDFGFDGTADVLAIDMASTMYYGNNTTLYRDPSSWYHVMWVQNGTTFTLYENGTVVGSGTMTNSEVNVNATTHYIGAVAGIVHFANCYLSNYCFIDGKALAPSTFGQVDPLTLRWTPKTQQAVMSAVGYFGNNGFYLPFNTNYPTGGDASGNNNNWTLSGTTLPTLYGDSPLVNYCTLNPLTSTTTMSAGNNTVSVAATNSLGANGTIQLPTSGKFYWEVFCAKGSGSGYGPGVGVALYSTASTNAVQGLAAGGWGLTANTLIYRTVNGTNTSISGSFPTNCILQVAFDATNGILYCGLNNAWYDAALGSTSNPSSGVNPFITGLRGLNLYPNVGCGLSTNSPLVVTANFGATPFAYNPPIGFLPLQSENVQTNQNIQNFAPDLVWIKGRSGATSNQLMDSVRGFTNKLASDSTAAETIDVNTVLQTLDGGYVVGDSANVNTAGATYVGWSWKANGPAVSNTSGSITSQVSAGLTQGMSIVTYTGTGANATVGHGLGVAPAMIIVRGRNGSYNWACWHQNLTSATYYVFLESNVAQASSATLWNSTLPTSSVFSIGTNVDVNTNTVPYVAYCFAEVPGFSKFGSYVGNGNADGTFVYCGFRPHWIMTKCITTTGDWRIYDTTRPGYNVQGGTLLADSAGAETTAAEIDITSNGFKFRVATDPNAAQTYIFAAFAEMPLKYATAQ